MYDKPYSQACENNKGPISEHLVHFLSKAKRVLEIGSGTGQHAVHFAAQMPHLFWQTSDRPEYHQGINAWLSEADLTNLGRPLELTLPCRKWPDISFDAVFSANTSHIMQKPEVEHMMKTISMTLPVGGVFCQYGPFIVNGEFTSQSNADFHHKLINEGYGGYRKIEELQAWASELELTQQISMPANNLLLVWQKI